MSRIRVNILGPMVLTVDDAAARLTPLNVKLLSRLIVADGEALSISRLYLDVWGPPARGVLRNERTQVQKGIGELRKAMDEDENSSILRTAQTMTAQRKEATYALELDLPQLDSAEFADLVNRALIAPPATSAALLIQALELWRGKPMAEVSDLDFAAPMVRWLNNLHVSARVGLARAHLALGRPELALPIAEGLVTDLPGESGVAEILTEARGRLQARHGDEVLRRDFPGLRTTLVVKRGDLFAEDDANLVVGFGDTFDTLTDDDVISRESVQGQLLHRIFGGDRKLLDKELQRALKPVEVIERLPDKPKGKRARYPIGTVVSLPSPGRRIFGIAYCHQGAGYVTRSDPEKLRLSLDRLWPSVVAHGMLKPVAIPLVGARLARISELSREGLMTMIVDSFIQACRSGPVTFELRIVIPPDDLERIRLSEVAQFIETLDHNGMRP
ncbi:bacterial transcriptional activator domain-containing protein [Streptosporangiaceae bacterium NEAU-GS5]|nr:bacterial transcriptional activator domain-containing protein [Streptosporangiaceae bacterium NEAU-GS5]